MFHNGLLCNFVDTVLSLRTPTKKQTGYSWITTEYLALARDCDYHTIKFNELKKKSTETGQTDNGSVDELWEKFKSLRNKTNNMNKRL